MIVSTIEELGQIRENCRKLVSKRALAAGAASAIPGAFVGMVTDVRILMELLPRINTAFGLDPDQIDALDEQAKQQILVLIGSAGSQAIGRFITKEIVLSAAKAAGVRMTVKAAASWVPLIGSAVGGALGFGMMKYVGNQHINECYDIVRQSLLSNDDTRVIA